jgi:hypothetical protein
MKGEGDMKSELKIKIVLAAILTIATLLGVNALVSAVYRADHGVTRASSVWHQDQEPTRRAAEIAGIAIVVA